MLEGRFPLLQCTREGRVNVSPSFFVSRGRACDSRQLVRVIVVVAPAGDACEAAKERRRCHALPFRER